MNVFCLKRGRGLKVRLGGRHLDPPKRPLSSQRTLSRFNFPLPHFSSPLFEPASQAIPWVPPGTEGHNGVIALMDNFYQFWQVICKN